MPTRLEWIFVIPRIIHQTWKDHSVPEQFRSFQASWSRHNPGWTLRLWTDDDNLRLVEEDYPHLLDLYLQYPFAIQRADLARILYLHKHGGLYADLDVECLKPIDRALEGHDVVLGREYRGAGYFWTGQDFACNALMASTPGHEFWERLLARMQREFAPYRRWRQRAWYVLSTTGPKILDDAANEYRAEHDDLVIHPHHFFCAAPVTEYRLEVRLQEAQRLESYAIHHFFGTWLSRKQKVLGVVQNAVFRLFDRIRNRP